MMSESCVTDQANRYVDRSLGTISWRLSGWSHVRMKLSTESKTSRCQSNSESHKSRSRSPSSPTLLPRRRWRRERELYGARALRRGAHFAGYSAVVNGRKLRTLRPRVEFVWLSYGREGCTFPLIPNPSRPKTVEKGAKALRGGVLCNLYSGEQNNGMLSTHKDLSRLFPVCVFAVLVLRQRETAGGREISLNTFFVS